MCTNVWRPVVIRTAALAGTAHGLPVKITILPRPDGYHQIALNGRRAYTFTDDHHPGDARGYGFVTGYNGGHGLLKWRPIRLPATTPAHIPLTPTPTPR